MKSTKHHVRRVIGNTTLTYEEMSTLLAQVEACLNSRPLQALTDHDDLTALTPGHFLVGTVLNAVPEQSLLGVHERSVALATYPTDNHFWNCWSQEYLHRLIPRSKWRSGETKIKRNSLCLILNENSSPTKWPLARITKLYSGKDRRVRVVTVKTASSEFTRPFNKLVLLPEVSADLTEATTTSKEN